MPGRKHLQGAGWKEQWVYEHTSKKCCREEGQGKVQ